MTAIALVLLALTGPVGAAPESSYEVDEHRLFVIAPELDPPPGQTVLLTTWTVPDGLDYRQRADELIGTGPPGKYAIKLAVVTATTEGDVIKLPVKQHHWQATLTISGKSPRPPPEPDDPTTKKVDRATYVYERTQGGVPREIAAKFRELNERGIIATAVDKDTTDGTGNVPEQYRIAFGAATKLPALVIQAGPAVVRVVENPLTADDVEGAIK